MTPSIYAESLQLARTLRATLNATQRDAALGTEMCRALVRLPLDVARAKRDGPHSDRRSGTSGASR
jgi:hypothetical protein